VVLFPDAAGPSMAIIFFIITRKFQTKTTLAVGLIDQQLETLRS
jgi:hypothetical protein